MKYIKKLPTRNNNKNPLNDIGHDGLLFLYEWVECLYDHSKNPEKLIKLLSPVITWWVDLLNFRINKPNLFLLTIAKSIAPNNPDLAITKIKFWVSKFSEDELRAELLFIFWEVFEKQKRNKMLWNKRFHTPNFYNRILLDYRVRIQTWIRWQTKPIKTPDSTNRFILVEIDYANEVLEPNDTENLWNLNSDIIELGMLYLTLNPNKINFKELPKEYISVIKCKTSKEKLCRLLEKNLLLMQECQIKLPLLEQYKMLHVSKQLSLNHPWVRPYQLSLT